MLCSWASRILSFRSQRWGSCHLARRANKQWFSSQQQHEMNWKRTISTIRRLNNQLLFTILRGNIVDDVIRGLHLSSFTSRSFNNLNRNRSSFENSIQILRNKRRAFCHLNVEEETKSFVEECNNVGERQQHSFLNSHHSVTEWFPVFKFVIIVMSSYLFNK